MAPRNFTLQVYENTINSLRSAELERFIDSKPYETLLKESLESSDLQFSESFFDPNDKHAFFSLLANVFQATTISALFTKEIYEYLYLKAIAMKATLPGTDEEKKLELTKILATLPNYISIFHTKYPGVKSMEKRKSTDDDYWEHQIYRTLYGYDISPNTLRYGTKKVYDTNCLLNDITKKKVSYDINRDVDNPSKDEPSMSVVLIKNNDMSNGVKNSLELSAFFNMISNIEMSRAMPFFNVTFVLPHIAKKQTKTVFKTATVNQFLFGSLKNTNEVYDSFQARVVKSKDRIGVETNLAVFTMPQTMLNMNEKAGHYDIYNSEDQKLRVTSVHSKTSPFMTLKSFDIDLAPTKDLMYFKSGKLTLVLHDRTRMADIAPFIKPDLLGSFGAELAIEYGYHHPDGDKKNKRNFSINPIGDLLHSAKCLEKYTITNTQFSLNQAGEIEINLSIAMKGPLDIKRSMLARYTSNTMNFNGLTAASNYYYKAVSEFKRVLQVTDENKLFDLLSLTSLFAPALNGDYVDVKKAEHRNQYKEFEEMLESVNAAISILDNSRFDFRETVQVTLTSSPDDLYYSASGHYHFFLEKYVNLKINTERKKSIIAKILGIEKSKFIDSDMNEDKSFAIPFLSFAIKPLFDEEGNPIFKEASPEDGEEFGDTVGYYDKEELLKYMQLLNSKREVLVKSLRSVVTQITKVTNFNKKHIKEAQSYTQNIITGLKSNDMFYDNDFAMYFKKIYSKSLSSSKYVTLGTFLTCLIGSYTVSLMKYDEIQFVFYNVNERSGLASKFTDVNDNELTLSLASILIDRSYLESLLKSIFIDKTKITVEALIMRVITSIILTKDNPTFGFQDLYKRKDVMSPVESISKDARKRLINGDVIGRNVTDRLNYFYYGDEKMLYDQEAQFNPPNIRISYETISDVKDLNRTICRISIYDQNDNPYQSVCNTFNSATVKKQKGITELLRIEKQIEKLRKKIPKDPKKRTKKSKAFKSYAFALQRAEKIYETLTGPDGIFELVIEGDESYYKYKEGKNFTNVKEKVKKLVPTATFGSNYTPLLSAAASSMNNGILSTMYMVEPDRNGIIQNHPNSIVDTPMKIMPTQCSIETLGCPWFNFGQFIFLDFETGTTMDNIYNIGGIKHSLAPGVFKSSVTLLPGDTYGKYEGLSTGFSKVIESIPELPAHHKKKIQAEKEKKERLRLQEENAKSVEVDKLEKIDSDEAKKLRSTKRKTKKKRKKPLEIQDFVVDSKTFYYSLWDIFDIKNISTTSDIYTILYFFSNYNIDASYSLLNIEGSKKVRRQSLRLGIYNILKVDSWLSNILQRIHKNYEFEDKDIYATINLLKSNDNLKDFAFEFYEDKAKALELMNALTEFEHQNNPGIYSYEREEDGDLTPPSEVTPPSKVNYIPYILQISLSKFKFYHRYNAPIRFYPSLRLDPKGKYTFINHEYFYPRERKKFSHDDFGFIVRSCDSKFPHFDHSVYVLNSDKFKNKYTGFSPDFLNKIKVNQKVFENIKQPNDLYNYFSFIIENTITTEKLIYNVYIKNEQVILGLNIDLEVENNQDTGSKDSSTKLMLEKSVKFFDSQELSRIVMGPFYIKQKTPDIISFSQINAGNGADLSIFDTFKKTKYRIYVNNFFEQTKNLVFAEVNADNNKSIADVFTQFFNNNSIVLTKENMHKLYILNLTKSKFIMSLENIDGVHTPGTDLNIEVRKEPKDKIGSFLNSFDLSYQSQTASEFLKTNSVETIESTDYMSDMELQDAQDLEEANKDKFVGPIQLSSEEAAIEEARFAEEQAAEQLAAAEEQAKVAEEQSKVAEEQAKADKAAEEARKRDPFAMDFSDKEEKRLERQLEESIEKEKSDSDDQEIALSEDVIVKSGGTLSSEGITGFKLPVPASTPAYMKQRIAKGQAWKKNWLEKEATGKYILTLEEQIHTAFIDSPITINQPAIEELPARQDAERKAWTIPEGTTLPPVSEINKERKNRNPYGFYDEVDPQVYHLLEKYFAACKTSSWNTSTFWSGAYISWFLKPWHFPVSGGHSRYCDAAKNNRIYKRGKWYLKSLICEDHVVKPGNVLVMPGKRSAEWVKKKQDLKQQSWIDRASHGDLVYKVEKGWAYLCGGNVGNTLGDADQQLAKKKWSKLRIRLDKNGRISTKNLFKYGYIIVMQYVEK